MDLILASHSTGRAQLLRAAGLSFRQVPSDLDEPPREPGEALEPYVVRVAGLKARAVAALHPSALVLAADTVLELDGELLGKPGSREEATAMLVRLGGRKHRVASGYLLRWAERDWQVSGADSARVWIRAWDEDRMRRYVEETNPLRFAGAYALQGEGAVLVERVEGDPATVIGLPVAAVLEALAEAGRRG
jgi:septum formation protein